VLPASPVLASAPTTCAGAPAAARSRRRGNARPSAARDFGADRFELLRRETAFARVARVGAPHHLVEPVFAGRRDAQARFEHEADGRPFT
jgi:hypothetical protein